MPCSQAGKGDVGAGGASCLRAVITLEALEQSQHRLLRPGAVLVLAGQQTKGQRRARHVEWPLDLEVLAPDFSTCSLAGAKSWPLALSRTKALSSQLPYNLLTTSRNSPARS